MSVKPAAKAIYKRGALTAGQAMAEKREDFKNVSAALKDFDTATLGQAIRLLKSDALYRSEKVLGAATWLRDLHNSLGSKHSTQRENKLWKAIAAAPAGFCHPRSSMIGTLLEDIAAGKNFEDVSRAFAAKMHPLQYQRPQAAPAAGTIEQAEKLVEKLGIQASLPRRFMRPDEVKTIWVPKKAQRGRKDGVFSHLKPKEASAQQSMELPPVKITWEKFRRTILGDAERIEYYLKKRDEYCILVTAVNAGAPPIIQWDRLEERNPASCYLWHGGSPASQYGLSHSVYVDVASITLLPGQWGSKVLAHQGEGVIFLIQGARETRNPGAALFPELLKSELHGVRSVIEAYSKTAKMEYAEGPHAIGPLLSKGSGWTARVRVTTEGQTAVYDLDRWD